MLEDLMRNPLLRVGAKPPRRLLAALLELAFERCGPESNVMMRHLMPDSPGLAWLDEEASTRGADIVLTRGRDEWDDRGSIGVFVAGGDQPTGAALDGMADRFLWHGPICLEESDIQFALPPLRELLLISPLVQGQASSPPLGEHCWNLASYEQAGLAIHAAAPYTHNETEHALFTAARDLTFQLTSTYHQFGVHRPDEPIAHHWGAAGVLRRLGIAGEVAHMRMQQAQALIDRADATPLRAPVQVVGSGTAARLQQLVRLADGDRLGWQYNGRELRTVAVTHHHSTQGREAAERRREYLRDRYAWWVESHPLYEIVDDFTEHDVKPLGDDGVYCRWSALGATPMDVRGWAERLPARISQLWGDHA
jgi:hypothetical protein